MNTIILSLIIPAQNDEMSLALVIQEALAIVPHHVEDFELIIVDAGSRDRSMQVAAQLAAQHEPVVVLRPRQAGYGHALRYALEAARGTMILLIDANRHVSLSDLARVLPVAEQAEVVLGYRSLESKAGRPSSSDFIRNLGAALFGISARDLDCGFKLFASSLLRSLDLQTSGNLIDIEIVAKAEWQGARVREVAINYDPAIRAVERQASWGELWQLWRVMAAYRLQHAGPKRSWSQRALFGGLGALLLACLYAIRRRS